MNIWSGNPHSILAVFIVVFLQGLIIIKAGLSFQYDNFNEVLNDVDYSRTQMVPGMYAEYSYNYKELFD